MKRSYLLFSVLVAVLLLQVPGIYAQQENQGRPAYVAVSTWHWNMDYQDFDMDTWKAVEKEYFDKVTSRNELIMGSGVYMHHFTPDNREILMVNAYGSWDDIDKAGKRDEELSRAAWPDEESRKAFFKKRDAYYANFHSDEIYATMPNARPTNIAETKIVYIRKNHFALPEIGSDDEFNSLEKEYVDNVLAKNEFLKGYYPLRHAWGSDRTEFAEAYFVDSMADLDKMFDRNEELFKEHWADEAGRKERQEKMSKYFTGVHGDYLYTVVPELVK